MEHPLAEQDIILCSIFSQKDFVFNTQSATRTYKIVHKSPGKGKLSNFLVEGSHVYELTRQNVYFYKYFK